MGQKIAAVIRAAMNEVLPQAMAGLRRQSGKALQLRIGLIIARDDGEGDIFLAAAFHHLFHAIGPIIHTTQQTHDHQFCGADDVADVKIDGHVVAQVHQVGQAQARRAGCGRILPGRRQHLQIRVRC